MMRMVQNKQENDMIPNEDFFRNIFIQFGDLLDVSVKEYVRNEVSKHYRRFGIYRFFIVEDKFLSPCPCLLSHSTHYSLPSQKSSLNRFLRPSDLFNFWISSFYTSCLHAVSFYVAHLGFMELNFILFTDRMKDMRRVWPT